jgi:hypothetical protein
VWLLLIGVLWLLAAIWVMLVMSGISTPAMAVWLLFVMYYAGPLALILGSTFVLVRRCIRIGVLLAFFACGWLTWLIASEVWPRRPDNAPMGSMEFHWLSVVLVLIVILSDLAVIKLLGTMNTATDKT